VDPRRIPGDTVTLDTLLYARIDGGARYLLQAHGRRALTAVVPRLPRNVEPWRMGSELGFRRGCGRDEGWHATAVQWRGGIPGVMGGVMVPVSAEDGQATRVDVQGRAHRVTLAGERFVVEGAGWRGEASLAGLRGRAVAARKGDCDEWMGPPPELPSSTAVVPLPDAAGRVRAQLLLQSITVGGPRMASGTAQVGDTATVVARTPPTPGTAVQQVRGYLIVPR
jgi:hypothetical protein